MNVRGSDPKTLVSIKDIAREANVSIGTVDRVIHERGRVSQETMAAVKRLIGEFHYRPNIYARNLSLAKTFRFGVLMPGLSQDSGYWRLPARGIENAQRSLDAYRVRIRHFHFDRYSEHSFESALRNALNEEVDGLLIAPVVQRAAERFVPTIPSKIPCVFFDSTVPGMKCLSWIGQDPYQSGVLAANLLRKAVREHGTVAVIRVVPEDFHINERIRGFQSVLKGSRELHPRLYEADSHGDAAAFRRLSERLLSENNDLQGIFVSNAWTHSIAKYIHALSPKRKVIIVGYDLVAENIRCLKGNVIDFLISQRPEMQGYEGIYALYRHLVLGERVSRRIVVPLDILTKDNIRYYDER